MPLDDLMFAATARKPDTNSILQTHPPNRVTDLPAVDPVLPQLTRAWDSEWMRTAFERCLRTTTNGPIRVDDCTLERFRHRLSKRAIILYRLAWFEPHSGCKVQQWATGLVYAGSKAQRLVRECRANIPVGAIQPSSNRLQPFVYLSELDMLVQLYPHDHRIPALSQIAREFPHAMQADFLKKFRPGNWRWVGCDIEPVRYRPTVGATLKITAHAQDNESCARRSKAAYMKVYGSEDVQRIRRVYERLGEYCRATRQTFVVPSPIYCHVHEQVLLVEQAPGRSLGELAMSGGDTEAATRACARAVSALHLSDAPTFRYASKEDSISSARRVANYLCTGCPHLAEPIRDLIAEIAGKEQIIGPHPTHFDLKPEHLLIDDGRVTFIDVDHYCAANPLQDVATLLARLEAMPFATRGARARARAVAEIFLDEYFRHVPRHWRDRLALQYAGACLQVALYYLQHLVESWPQHIAERLTAARSALDGRLF